MNVEIVEDVQRIEDLGHRVLAVQVAEPVLGRVLDPEEDAEEPELVEDRAIDSSVMLSGRPLTAIAMPPTPSSSQAVRAAARKRAAAFSGSGRKKLSSWKLKMRTPWSKYSCFISATMFSTLRMRNFLPPPRSIPGVDAAERALAPAAAAGEDAGDRLVEVAMEGRALGERQGIEVVRVTERRIHLNGAIP